MMNIKWKNPLDMWSEATGDSIHLGFMGGPGAEKTMRKYGIPRNFDEIVLEKARQNSEYAKHFLNDVIDRKKKYGFDPFYAKPFIIILPKLEKIVKKYEKVIQDNEKKRLNILSKKIKDFLKKRGEKMYASDIDGFLKHQNVEEIKKLCEKMYFDNELNRTSNYRYFMLIQKNKNVKRPDNTPKHSGQGTQALPEGSKYEGEYRNGKMHGQGTWTWPDGSEYVGEFENGKRHGQGTLTNPNGDTCSGIWCNDKAPDKEQKKTKTSSESESEESDVEKELNKYKDLFDKGLITQEEYDAKRKQILGL